MGIQTPLVWNERVGGGGNKKTRSQADLITLPELVLKKWTVLKYYIMQKWEFQARSRDF